MMQKYFPLKHFLSFISLLVSFPFNSLFLSVSLSFQTFSFISGLKLERVLYADSFMWSKIELSGFKGSDREREGERHSMFVWQMVALSHQKTLNWEVFRVAPGPR